MRADFLLNFQRPSPQQRPKAPYTPPKRRPRATGARPAPAAFARGRFVQSAFRLVVEEETPDVVQASYDADALLDWSSVRRVDLRCEECPKCPICLDLELVVPKITRCGHVFCAPCIMRYFLALQEYNGHFWQRCPVCNTQQLSPDELISVRFEVTKAIREGDRVSFALAHRAAAATVVRVGGGSEPSACDEGAGAALPIVGEAGWHLSRLVRLPHGQAGRLLADELEALARYRGASIAEGDMELLPSIDAASALLEQHRLQGRGAGRGVDGGGSAVLGELALPAPAMEADDSGEEADERGEWHAAAEGIAMEGAEGDAENRDREALRERSSRRTGEDQADEEEVAEDEGSAEDAGDAHAENVSPHPPEAARSGPSAFAAKAAPTNPSAALPLTPSSTAAASPGMDPLGRAGTGDRKADGGGGGGHVVSFYQAADGRLIFLQPFFTRLVLYEHGGNWEALPPSLGELRVERVQEVSISEETRKRCRFLSHLPLGSLALLAEVDLRHLLGRETKEHFAEEFSRRRATRKKEQQRVRKEEKWAKNRAAEDEERYYQSLNLPHPSTLPVQQRPTREDFAAALPTSEPRSEGQPADGDAEEEEEDVGPTLADKIKDRMAAGCGRGKAGKSAASSCGVPSGPGPPQPPSPVAALSASASASGPASAWGPGRGSSRVAAPAASATEAQKGEHAAGEDARAEPSFNYALGDALGEALRSVSAAEGAAGDSPEAGGGSAVGKKRGRAAKAKTIRLFG